MEVLLMGFATGFNVLIIFKKIELKRFQDAFFDSSLLVLLSLVFGGSLGGMMVATIASAVISIYFLFNQPDFTKLTEDIDFNFDYKSNKEPEKKDWNGLSDEEQWEVINRIRRNNELV